MACLDPHGGSSGSESDPGIYVCSTDMIFFPDIKGLSMFKRMYSASNKTTTLCLTFIERFCIRNKPICVVSSLADETTVRKNGIYDVDGDRVKNIFYMPGEQTFNKIKSNNGLYNFVILAF
jgi:hypothetical protein